MGQGAGRRPVHWLCTILHEVPGQRGVQRRPLDFGRDRTAARVPLSSLLQCCAVHEARTAFFSKERSARESVSLKMLENHVLKAQSSQLLEVWLKTLDEAEVRFLRWGNGLSLPEFLLDPSSSPPQSSSLIPPFPSPLGQYLLV